MGVGMALFEETRYENRTGQPINGNFADYLVPTCADLPDLDVTFLDYPDYIVNEYGARGIGEIGMAGVRSCNHRGRLPRHRSARTRVAGAHRELAAVADSRRLKRCGGRNTAIPSKCELVTNSGCKKGRA